MLATEPELATFQPVFGFPELKTPLPGGRRETQTDLLVVAARGNMSMTLAVEGKVDETFGPVVEDWLVDAGTPGKRVRLVYLAGLLGLDKGSLSEIRYQLVHRTAAAKIEAERNASDVAAMVVHSWGQQHEGFHDFEAFAQVLGVEAGVGHIGYSETADVWLGWAAGDKRFLRA
jgi:hypothetical protein